MGHCSSWALHSALCLCLVVLCGGTAAQQPDRCRTNMKLGDPAYDGQLYVQYRVVGRKKETRELVRSETERHSVPFGDSLYFCYGLLRENSADRKEGAIVIRTVRAYDANNDRVTEYKKDTLLFRNKFPHDDSTWKGWVRRKFYQSYHRGDIENYHLRTNFHRSITDTGKWRTDERLQRRKSFLFPDITDPPDDKIVLRAYNLYYKAIRPKGTWIYFDVGADSSFDFIDLLIIDLNPPGLGIDLVPRKWHLKKRAKGAES